MKDELDILREVGTTAAAHGSIALSEMLKRKIILKAPAIYTVPSAELGKTLQAEEGTVVLQSEILSGLTGKVMYILEEKSSYKFLDIYQQMGSNIKRDSVFTEMAMSLMKEIGTVVILAYINTLGYFLKKMIIPSVPVLMHAPVSAILRDITSSASGQKGQVLVVESVFQEPKAGIKGNFWLVLTPEAAEEIKKACQKILNDI